jgi:hypothetical protein
MTDTSREALIAILRSKYRDTKQMLPIDYCHAAADMLEADARLEKLAAVGREMVEITTTVMYEDEWPAIPMLWLECMKERDEAKAKLVQQVAVPAGYVLVPIEPTLAMMLKMPASSKSTEWKKYYAAMLAAAPKGDKQ